MSAFWTAQSLAALCPFLPLADQGIAALRARFPRAVLLDTKKIQEKAKEEGSRRRKPGKKKRAISDAKAGSSPPKAVGAVCRYLLSIQPLRFQKPGFAFVLVLAPRPPAGETETPIANTAERNVKATIHSRRR